MYKDGQGVPQDYVSAYAWLNIAVKNDDDPLVQTRDELLPIMTPEQVAKGQELLDKLLSKSKKD